MLYNWHVVGVHTFAKGTLPTVIWSRCFTYKMRCHHPSDKNDHENSVKNNVNKALYTVSGTW